VLDSPEVLTDPTNKTLPSILAGEISHMPKADRDPANRKAPCTSFSRSVNSFGESLRSLRSPRSYPLILAAPMCMFSVLLWKVLLSFKSLLPQKAFPSLWSVATLNLGTKPSIRSTGPNCISTLESYAYKQVSRHLRARVLRLVMCSDFLRLAMRFQIFSNNGLIAVVLSLPAAFK